MSTETPEDFKESLGKLLTGRSHDEMVFIYENISMMVRAFEGKAVDPKDSIDKLTNIRNIFERSGFPTYVILSQVTYLRLLYHIYGEPAKICLDWATFLSEDLISYKRQGREEYRDMVKAASVQEGQRIFVGGSPQSQEPKKRPWQRTPKETTEFKES